MFQSPATELVTFRRSVNLTNGAVAFCVQSETDCAATLFKKALAHPDKALAYRAQGRTSAPGYHQRPGLFRPGAGVLREGCLSGDALGTCGGGDRGGHRGGDTRVQR